MGSLPTSASSSVPAGADLDALVGMVPGALTDEELREAVRTAQRLRARLDGLATAMAGAFDARCVWAADGARSAGAWMAARCEVTQGAANAEVRLARVLRHMPVVEAASLEGRIGREKVKALVWARQEDLEEAFADCEDDLVATVEELTVAKAWKFLRSWVADVRARLALNEPDGPEPDEGVGPSKITLGQGLDGRWFGTLDLEAVDGEVLANAIEHQLQSMWEADVFGPHDGLTVAQRRAQAMVEVIARGTRGGGEDGTARPLVLALIDAATLTGVRPPRSSGVAGDNQSPSSRPGTDDTASADTRRPTSSARPTLDPYGLGLALDEPEMMRITELSLSGPVSTATIRRLVCEGTVCPVIVGEDGNPLRMGREIRIFNRKQRRALRVRDGHCVFAGCSVAAEHCIAHHLVYWRHGGPTDLDNAALVCRYHHRLLHEGGFGLERDEHGRFVTTRPDGTAITGCYATLPVVHRRRTPPGPDPGDDLEQAYLTRRARERGEALIRCAQARRAGLAVPLPA